MTRALVLVGFVGLGSCSCQERKPPEKSPADVNLSKGVSPIPVSPKSVPQSKPMAAAKPLQLVVRAWHLQQKVAERRVTDLLTQTKAGYTYAVTGDGTVRLAGIEPSPLPSVKKTQGKSFQGIKVQIATLERAEIGGTAALITAKKVWKKGHIVSAQTLLESGLRELASQSGGSGRIYPLRLGTPRFEEGEIRAEITARILKDGASGLP